MNNQQTNSGIRILNQYSFGARLGFSECLPEKPILAAIQGTDWIMFRTTAQELEIFRLTNTKTKTHCDFVCSGEIVHILMFQVSAESEGKYFIARNDFRFLADVFWKCGYSLLKGHALDNVEGNPIKSKEWRNRAVKIGGKNFRKLQIFWLRLGGFLENNAIVFLAPELTLKAKSLAATWGENPYSEIAPCSIYGRELSAKLKD